MVLKKRFLKKPPTPRYFEESKSMFIPKIII